MKIYNNRGVFFNIQFKVISRRVSPTGSLESFTLAWIHYKEEDQNKESGKFINCIEKDPDNEEENSYSNWRVRAVFKWKKDYGYYKRSSKLYMHHSHPLDENKVKFGRNNRDEIKKEIELYLKTRIPFSLIHTIINKKFNTILLKNKICYF